MAWIVWRVQQMWLPGGEIMIPLSLAGNNNNSKSSSNSYYYPVGIIIQNNNMNNNNTKPSRIRNGRSPTPFSSMDHWIKSNNLWTVTIAVRI